MNDFDADLLALLSPGAASPAPAQPEPQEPAAAAPELDLAALLDPVQAAPEPAAVAVQPDDFDAGQLPAPTVQTEVPEPISQLTEIAARRLALETELYDLFLQLESAQELLKRGLWASEHASMLRTLRKRIDSKGLAWNWTETQAWRVAYDAGLIPPQPRPKDWTPFQLLEGHRP